MAHANPVNLPASGKSVTLYVDWTEASSVQQIKSGIDPNNPETLLTSMGKIAKWKTEFKKLVFTDLSISSGTAETGKAITALSYNTSTGVITATKGTFLTSADLSGYIPKAGATDISGSLETNSTSAGFIVPGSNGRKMTLMNGNLTLIIGTSSWSNGIVFYKTSTLGMIGAFGTSSTCDYFFMGKAYNDYSMRVENNDTGKMTLRGTVPQIKFQQTTSSAVYDNNNAGIKAYPAPNETSTTASGMNMTIQSGGNMIIGSGEYPSAFYNLADKTTGYPNYWSDNGEYTFIGSDNYVVIHTKANTIANKKTFVFGDNFDLAVGAKIVFKTNTEVSPVEHFLTTAATTTQTWTLPNASGTIALTNGTNSAVSQSDTVYVTADNISDGSYFSVPFFLQTTPSTGYKSLVANGAFKGYAKDGTANVEGASYLILGNATKLSSASNKTGVLRLYSAGDKYINIRPLGGEDTITNNRTIYLPNENGTVSLIPNGKYSFFYDNNSDFASYAWHKFAEITVTEANIDNTITFLVCKTYGTITKETGLLTAHIRTSETKVFSSCHFAWHWANQNINPSDFVLVYTNTAATSCKVELWCKQTARYDGWIFRVLKEHSRLGSADAWTLYKISGHGSASYTVGTGTYTSIKIPLASQVAITDGSTYIKSRDVANVYANAGATTSSLFYTAAFVKTNTGGWSIGTLPSNDKLYFLWTTDENYNNNNNSYTTWTIDSDGLFTGTAAYANAGKHVLSDPNSEVLYGLTFHASGGTEENKFFRTNNGLRALTRIGTTSQIGYGFVVLGNATASGTDGNKYGGVRIYTTGTKYVQISGTNDNYLSFSSSTVTAGDGIIPVTTAIYDLGASTNLWRKVYCSYGVYLRDNSNNVYGGLIDNGVNLWIGAHQAATTHHVGGTFISSGYDSSTSKGNPTIKIAVPNDSNNDATSYNVYHTGLGVGKDGFISFPNDGQYTASTADITGALVITCPFGMTSIMMSFTVDIYNYIDNECVSYRISGYNYSTGPKWVNCSASSFGDGTKANLTVRFGYNGTKAQIQIGETNTAWRWPQVRIRDILLGHQNATDRTFMSNRTGWTITFVTTNVSNVTKTITDTQIYSLSTHTHVVDTLTWSFSDATTRRNAVKALTNENVGTNANYFLTITTSWGKAGYTSVADAKTVLGIGKAVPSDAVFTDKYLLQSATTTTNYRPLVLGTKSTNDTTLLDETITGQGYLTQKIYAQPSTGAIFACQYTAVGTSPGIWFNQITTDKVCTGQTFIKAFPASQYGTNMVINSGGNMIIGGGEYPSNFYSATKRTNDSWSDTGENLYLGADSQVLVHVNANTTANRKTFAFGTNGNFCLPPSGQIVFRTGDEGSGSVSYLTSAATSTKTWTLPDAEGTIALTSNIPAAGSWTTLAGSSWTDKSKITQADSTMYYINFRNGFVEICGKFKLASANTSVRITTIAAAYRPSNIMRFGSIYTSGNILLNGASICITTAGVIDIVGSSNTTFSTGSTYYFYLRFVK